MIEKIVRLGVTDGGDVFCRLTLADGRLSITGVVGPKRNGDCRGSCGQIVMGLSAPDIKPAPGWDEASIGAFFAHWKRWHLNDMRAGTPAQEMFLRLHKVGGGYEERLEALTAAGLNPDNGYVYGSRWLTEDLPAWMPEYIESLPVADKEPAWV